MQANLESAENIFSNLPEEDDSVVVRFVAVVDCHFLQLKHVHGGGPTYQDLHLQGTVSREIIWPFLQLKHVHGGGPAHQDLHLKGEVLRKNKSGPSYSMQTVPKTDETVPAQEVTPEERTDGKQPQFSRISAMRVNPFSAV